MNLAKGRNGRIGRQRPGQGMVARIDQPSTVGYHRNLYLSEGQIKADQAYFTAQEAKRQAMGAARDQRQRQIQAEAQRRDAQARAFVAQKQVHAKLSPMNQKLLAHFSRNKGMGATSNHVANTLAHNPVTGRNGATSGYTAKPRPPADFSNSGANMHLVPGEDPHGPYVWRSDFRQHMPRGNPLTRDGAFGPKVTDYDRFVKGQDVNQSVVKGADMPIAGNTIAGHYQGPGKRLGGFLGRAMGDEFDDFDNYDFSADDVDFSSFDDAPTGDGSDFADYEASAPDDGSYWNTGNVAPTEEELAADELALDTATPEQPGFFDKVWSAAEVQASKTLPAALQQQMLATLASGGKVGTKGNTVVLTQPGAPPRAVVTPRTSIFSGVNPTLMYASLGLAAVGLLLILMKHSRSPAVA